MQGGDYDTATSVIEFAKRLLGFQKKVEGLVSEWEELEDLRDAASPAVQEIVSKRCFGKREKGEVTPHTAYFRPILEALMEMGGSGKTRAVLDRVGEKMKVPPGSIVHRLVLRDNQGSRNNLESREGDPVVAPPIGRESGEAMDIPIRRPPQ